MIKLYTKDNCPNCDKIKLQLNTFKVKYSTINVDEHTIHTIDELSKKYNTPIRSVPFLIDDEDVLYTNVNLFLEKIYVNT